MSKPYVYRFIQPPATLNLPPSNFYGYGAPGTIATLQNIVIGQPMQMQYIAPESVPNPTVFANPNEYSLTTDNGIVYPQGFAIIPSTGPVYIPKAARNYTIFSAQDLTNVNFVVEAIDQFGIPFTQTTQGPAAGDVVSSAVVNDASGNPVRFTATILSITPQLINGALADDAQAWIGVGSLGQTAFYMVGLNRTGFKTSWELTFPLTNPTTYKVDILTTNYPIYQPNVRGGFVPLTSPSTTIYSRVIANDLDEDSWGEVTGPCAYIWAAVNINSGQDELQPVNFIFTINQQGGY